MQKSSPRKIAQELAERKGVSSDAAREWVEDTISCIKQALLEGGSFSIPGFGTFVAERKPSQVRKVFGKVTHLSERLSVFFRRSEDLAPQGGILHSLPEIDRDVDTEPKGDSEADRDLLEALLRMQKTAKRARTC